MPSPLNRLTHVETPDSELSGATVSGQLHAVAQAMLDGLPGLACLVGEGGKVTAVSASWRRVHAAEQLLPGHSLSRVVQALQSRTRERCAAGALYEVAAGRQDELTLHDSDRGIVRISARRVQIEPGQSAILVQLLPDHGASDAGAVERDDRLTEAVRAVGIYWWEWDLERGIVTVSEEALRAMRLDSSPSMSAGVLFDLIHPDDREAARQARNDALTSGADDYTVEYRIRFPDRGWRWMQVRGHITRTREGRPLRVVGVSTDIHEVRSAREQLETERRAHRKLALVADRTSDGVVIADGDGRVEWTNAGFERMLGLRDGAVRGRWAADLVSRDLTPTQTVTEVVDAFDGSRPARVTAAVRGGDGRPVWCDFDLQPAHDAAGAIEQWILVLRATTEQLRERILGEARAAALAHAAAGRPLAEAIRDLLDVIESGFPDQRYVALLTSEAGQGQTVAVSQNLDPRETERITQLYEALSGAPRSGRAGDRHDPASGPLWLPLIGVGQRGLGTLAVRFNESCTLDEPDLAFLQRVAELIGGLVERDRNHRETARREAQLRALAEALPISLCYVDTDFVFRYCNPAAARLVGMSRESMQGAPVADIVGQQAYEEALPMMRRALQGETVSMERERGYAHPGRLYLRSTYIPDMDADGRVAGFFSLVEDISEFRVREHELEAARTVAAMSDAAKSALLRDLNREVREPLNVVLGFAQLLSSEDGCPDDPRRREDFVSALQGGAAALERALDDLPAQSEISGDRPTARTAVSVLDALQSVLDALGVAPGGRVWIDAGQETEVLGDPMCVRQILFDMIGQALRASGDPVMVQVRSGFDGSAIAVSEAPQDAAGPDAADGLVLSRRLVRAMSGSLSPEVEADGNRALVLRLPRPKPA